MTTAPDLSRPAASADDVPDLSRPRTSVSFVMYGQRYDGPPVIPAMVLMRYTKIMDAVDEKSGVEDQMNAMLKILEATLRKESYARFVAAMDQPEDGHENESLDMNDLQKAIEYLMEKHGMRPTESASDSQAGSASPADGTSSEAVTSDTVSTS
jgi:hypothetical protein